MVVMAAFPLSLVVVLSSVSFSIDIDILDFFPNCSYTDLALSFRGTSDMPRTELSSVMSQEYLDFYYPSSAIPLLGSGLGPQCKNGPGPQVIGPHIPKPKIARTNIVKASQFPKVRNISLYFLTFLNFHSLVLEFEGF